MTDREQQEKTLKQKYKDSVHLSLRKEILITITTFSKRWKIFFSHIDFVYLNLTFM